MAQVAPIGLGNLPSPLAPGQAAQDGAQIYAYGGTLYLLDSQGNSWQLNAPRGDVLPGDQNLLEWNFDPAAGGSAGVAFTAQAVNLMRINVRAPMKISNVWFHLASAAVTLTAGQSFVGLYNSAGTLLSGSAAIDSVLTGTPGAVSAALSTPQIVGAGFYWVAILVASATTAPKIAVAGNSAVNANVGLAPAQSRFGVGATAQTTLPATITPPAISNTNAQTAWVGVS
jgi:hypothetical protein